MVNRSRSGQETRPSLAPRFHDLVGEPPLTSLKN